MKTAALLLPLLVLFVPSNSFAASINLSNTPQNLTNEEEFTVDITLSGAAASSTNYLRAAFASEASLTSYFGYTFNHLSVWYNGSPSPIDPHQFLEIQISSEGTWSGQVKIKADINDTSFKGSGTYLLKVGRYTQSATSVSDWSNSATVTITVPSPTPNPSPSPSPSPTPTPPPVPSPTPTPIKSPSPSPKPSPKSSPSPSSQASTVLGETSDTNSSPSPSASPEAESGSLSKTKAAALITGAGAILIALSSGFYLWYSKLLGKEKSQSIEEIEEET